MDLQLSNPPAKGGFFIYPHEKKVLFSKFGNALLAIPLCLSGNFSIFLPITFPTHE
jgi:hypothetical protein